MSYNRVIKGQNGLQIATEAGNIDVNPQGTISLSKAVSFGDASTTRSNLGVEIGSDVQAYAQALADIAGISSPTLNHVLKWSGSAWAAAAEAADSTTATAPIVKTNDDLSLSLDSGNLEVNGSSELAIKAGGVGSSELAADSVDGSKVADNAIDSEHITTGAVDADHLAGSIPVSKLSDYLAAGAVATAVIADDAVTGDKIATGVALEGPQVSNYASFVSANAGANHDQGHIHATTSDDTTSNQSLHSLSDGDRYLFEVNAVAVDQTSGDTGVYRAVFASKQDSGTASILGSTNIEPIHEDAGASAWSLDFDANGADIRANLTGDASNTVRWSLAVKQVKCN